MSLAGRLRSSRLRIRFDALVVLVVALAQPQSSYAGIPEVIAPSAASAGRAGAGQTLADGGAGAVENVGTYGLTEQDEVRLLGTIGRIDLQAVEGVQRVDGRAGGVPQGAIAPHSVGIDGLKTVGPWLRLGGTVIFPMPWLYFHETKDPFVPHAFRWQNRAAQATASLGASVRLPVPGQADSGAAGPGGVWIGGSLALLPRANIEVDLDLAGVPGVDGGDPGIDVVLHDVDLAVRARIRPQLSLLVDLGVVRPALEGVRFAATWRGQTQADIDPIHLGIHVLSLGELHPLFSLVDRIDASVWLGLADLWDPHQVELGFGIERERFALAVDLCWNHWSALLPSYGRVVEGLDGEQGSLELQVQLGDAEPFRYGVGGSRSVDALVVRDTWDLSVGGEWRSPAFGPHGAGLVLRGGYRLVPKAVEPGTGPLALLDGDTHSLGLGAGLVLPSEVPHLRGRVRIDMSLLLSRIVGGPVGRDPSALADLSGLPVLWTDDATWGGGSVAAGSFAVTVPLGR